MSKLKLSILVLLTLAVLPCVSASAIPEIKLLPDTGLATTIQGSGFAPWQNVKIYWNDTQMVTLPYGAMLFAGPSGNFVAMITALNQTANTYEIFAENMYANSTKCNATAFFIVPDFNGLDGKNGINGTNITVEGPKGDKGDAGSVWFSGNIIPTNSTGKDGDFYLHTPTSNVYERKLSVWCIVTNINGLKGDQGSQGIQGLQGIQGMIGPTGLTGLTGSIGAIGATGVQGEKGDKGDTGDSGSGSGLDGTMWFTGTTAPSSTLGADNDLYLRTTTSNVYKKIDGTWEILMNIMGATGASGSDGATGATGATGLAGVVGAVGPLGPRGQVGETGAIGAQGIQGIQGVKGEIGDVGATGATGSQGLMGVSGKDADTNMLYLALIMSFMAILGVAWVYRLLQNEYEE